MNEVNEKIIERVKALLAMAGDTSSPHEASIAAGRARKLMDAHQITLADLKDSTGFGFANVDQEYRFPPAWKDILAVAVAVYNDCKCIKTRKWKSTNNSYTFQLVFQGYESDVQVAVSLYDYLTRTIDRLCQRYIATLSYSRYPAKLGDAYKKAASTEICNRLRIMTKERTEDLQLQMSSGTSLVIFKMKQVEAEFGAAKYTASRLVSRRGHDVEEAKARGRIDGRSVQIHQQVQ